MKKYKEKILKWRCKQTSEHFSVETDGIYAINKKKGIRNNSNRN